MTPIANITLHDMKSVFVRNKYKAVDVLSSLSFNMYSNDPVEI